MLSVVWPAMGTSGQGAQGGGAFTPLLFFGLMFAIFYFLLIRPQQQRQKKHQLMLAALKKGDRVLTQGGLFARVLDVKEDRVVATIADGVKVEIAKQSISALVERE
jgi:preprotein translocase subunit YajC